MKSNVGANVGANVPGTVRSNVGAAAGANVPGTVKANVGANAGATTALRPTAPAVNANTGVRAGANTPGGDIRTNVNAALNNRVNSPIRSNVLPGVNAGTNAAVKANVPGVGVGANVPGVGAAGVNASGIRAGANVNGALNAAGVRTGANVDGRAQVNNLLNGKANLDTRGQVVARNTLRPSWYNNGVYGNSRLNANLGGLIGATIGLNNGYNYLGANVGRANYWGGYYNPVNRWWGGNNWGGNNYPYFGNRWWSGRYVYRPFGYFNYIGYRPYGYWWGNPGWGGVNGFYSGYGWNSPYYYDYGTGGNVVYRDNNVYVDGTQVGTAEEYAQSAAALAAVDPAEVPATAAEDWLALGTFAVVESADPGDKDKIEPSRFVQIAVDKKGFVTGTFFNKKTDETYSLSGKIDQKTQRMAFSIDDNKDIVFETGIYNLTQEQTPVLVHLGPNKTETFVFVRLNKPDEPATERGAIDKLP